VIEQRSKHEPFHNSWQNNCTKEEENTTHRFEFELSLARAEQLQVHQEPNHHMQYRRPTNTASKIQH
jgi:hypothetical protein